MRVVSGALSDVGLKRKSNEDNYCADDEHGLYVVADGMGGHAAGEVASEVAVETIEEFIRLTGESQDVTWPFGLDESLSLNGNRLKTSIRFANRRVLEKTRGSSEYEGMATTVVATLVSHGEAEVAHVGDSRLYLIRQDLEVEMQVLELLDMDLLLLCSDGLTSMLEDDEILRIILADGNDKRRALSELVEAANRSGGDDNTTAVLLSLHDD